MVFLQGGESGEKHSLSEGREMSRWKSNGRSFARCRPGHARRQAAPAFCHIEVIVLLLCLAFTASIFLFVLRSSISDDPVITAADVPQSSRAETTMAAPRFTPYSAETPHFTPFSEYDGDADSAAGPLDTGR
ncbi:MAG: hypothetical protein DRP79_01485 [Planctomycetota bacterium]|nr:MAG: hypothetical protein DRP79_01485 [Planctomycetota bacterium]